MHTAYQLKIYTEALGNESIADEIIRFHFGDHGFTKYHAQGYWCCKWEQSVVYEIITRNHLERMVKVAHQAIASLKSANKQDAVYLTLTTIKETLL